MVPDFVVVVADHDGPVVAAVKFLVCNLCELTKFPLDCLLKFNFFTLCQLVGNLKFLVKRSSVELKGPI